MANLDQLNIIMGLLLLVSVVGNALSYSTSSASASSENNIFSSILNNATLEGVNNILDSNITQLFISEFWRQTDTDLYPGNDTIRILLNNTGGFVSAPYSTGDILSEEYDAEFGNEYGAISVGNGEIFISDLIIATMDLNGTFVLRSPPPSLTSDIEFAFVTSDNLVRFLIPISGPDFATYNPRSQMVGGDLNQNFENNLINCTAQGYTQIDCDTDSTGADLGVEDDLEVRGTVFINETILVGSIGQIGCIQIRDNDDGGWSKCTILDGVMTCSTGIC